MELKITTQDLNVEQQQIFDDLMREIYFSMEHDSLSTAEGVCTLTDYLTESHNVLLKVFMTDGGLEMIVQCPTIENLERLLSDHRSGHLIEVAERCLVTDEMKTILDLETVRLKADIKESYVEMLGKCATVSLRFFFFPP